MENELLEVYRVSYNGTFLVVITLKATLTRTHTCIPDYLDLCRILISIQINVKRMPVLIAGSPNYFTKGHSNT